MSKKGVALLTIFLVLFIDQVSKFIVKTSMILGQEFRVIGDWFIIHFTENEGMAFGLEFGGDYGKLVLTLFRILLAFFIAYYLRKLVKDKASTGLIISFSLIIAGALGNIIDSVFYGMIFSSSYQQAATFLPEAGGYATLFHGRVVDMLYFPIFRTYLPEWIPWMGGEYFIFFQPVFNIADSAITVGVFMILFFQKSFFPEDDGDPNPNGTSKPGTPDPDVKETDTFSDKAKDGKSADPSDQ